MGTDIGPERSREPGSGVRQMKEIHEQQHLLDRLDLLIRKTE